MEVGGGPTSCWLRALSGVHSDPRLFFLWDLLLRFSESWAKHVCGSMAKNSGFCGSPVSSRLEVVRDRCRLQFVFVGFVCLHKFSLSSIPTAHIQSFFPTSGPHRTQRQQPSVDFSVGSSCYKKFRMHAAHSGSTSLIQHYLMDILVLEVTPGEQNLKAGVP